MLVLSRKLDEDICIGDDVTIRVIAIQKDKVRIGITAPKATPVHRREVYEQILAAADSGAANDNQS